jgi:hypothetical protein
VDLQSLGDGRMSVAGRGQEGGGGDRGARI